MKFNYNRFIVKLPESTNIVTGIEFNNILTAINKLI